MSAFLKNWLIKVLGGWCLSVWGPRPPPPSPYPRTYSHREGGRGGGLPVRRLEGRMFTRGVENVTVSPAYKFYSTSVKPPFWVCRLYRYLVHEKPSLFPFSPPTLPTQCMVYLAYAFYVDYACNVYCIYLHWLCRSEESAVWSWGCVCVATSIWTPEQSRTRWQQNTESAKYKGKPAKTPTEQRFFFFSICHRLENAKKIQLLTKQ